MKKRTMGMLLILLLLLPVLTIPARADHGPKPLVEVAFPETEGLAYAAMLSPYEEYGPHRKVDKWDDWMHMTPERYREVLEALDGQWYFVGIAEIVSPDTPLRCGYYAPNPFRVLLWLPEEDAWYLSDSLEQYAMDSYFRAEVRDGTLELRRTGLPWSRALLLRMAITLVLELGLGFALGYRKRQQIAVILIVNVATQLLLNFLLMPKGFALAPLYFGAIFLTESLMKLLGISGERVQWIICMGIVYAVAEGLIVVIEAVTYNKLLPRWGEKKRFPGEYTLYAIAANLLSFLAGFFLQRI